MTDTADSPAARRVRFDPTRPRGADDYVHAHRHSRRVRFLKFALSTIAVVSVVGFVLTMRFADITGAALIGLAGLNIQEKSLVMDAPHLSGYDAERRPYQVKALKALQDLNNPKVVTLDTIDANFGTDGPDKVNVKARTGVFDGTKNSMVLRDGIAITTSDGFQATLQDAKVDIGKGDLVSRKPVEIRSRDGWLKANGVIIQNRGAKVTFVNGVSVNFVPPNDADPAAKPDDTAPSEPAAEVAAQPGDEAAARPAADKVVAKPAAATAKDAAAERLKSLTE